MRFKLLLLGAFLCCSLPSRAQWMKAPDSLLQIILPDGYRPYQHMQNANRVLGGWSALSMGVGTAQLFSPNPYIRAFGMQQLAWGAIDGGIALWGQHELRQGSKRAAAEERLRFRKVLLVNTLLDVGYVGLGWYLMRHNNPRWHGHGAGIVAQGGFLLLFDGINVALTF